MPAEERTRFGERHPLPSGESISATHVANAAGNYLKASSDVDASSAVASPTSTRPPSMHTR